MAAAALIVLALFLIRPGASRLKSRIIRSISASVGRPVDLGSVHIRLLPRPGFDLQNLVVYDDPSFGAEPILRASEVTAALRLTSLLRGRLEIARLDLTEPSLNLVHRETGHWNLEALLERTAHLPLAPTGKTKSEPRPAFPYIECSSGRINFKNGPEKKPYALTNADFSLWQESENTWGVRLKAQPFRTDMNLNDMGLLQVNGMWQRAETIRDTPLEVKIEWSRAQIGQLTKFITGNDQGWRGAILLDVAMKGTPAKLQITGSSKVDDFRRYDITSGKALRMAAYCDAEYSSGTHEFHQVMCNAPVGNGLITMTGNTGLPGSHRYSVVLTAEQVPVRAMMMLAQRVRKNLPSDLDAAGSVSANLTLHEDTAIGSEPQFEGRGQIADFHLSSASNQAEIGPQIVPFLLSSDSAGGLTRRQRVARNQNIPRDSAGMHLEFGPFSLNAPRAASPTVTGSIRRDGYNIAIVGEAEIAKTLAIARMAGLPALASTAEGSAQLDLQIAGTWAWPSTGDGRVFVPQVTGNAKLQNVQIGAHVLGGPVELVAADLQLLPEAVHVSRMNARAAGTTWTGSLEMRRGCGTPAACPVRFALNTRQVATSDISAWTNPGPRKRPWYQVLAPSREATPSALGSLHASGRVTAEHVLLHGVDATHVSVTISLENGKLQFSDLNANLLGGEHRGDWKIDFGAKAAICKGSGTLSGVALAELAGAMNDDWVTGTGNASYEVKGTCPADFWKSADGSLRAEIRDGVFPHISLADGAEPLQVTRLSGQAQLHDGKIEITETKLDSPDGTFQLTGTASLQREVDLKLTRVSNIPTNSGYTIGGTLSEPHITPLTSAEQAQLK
jgi:hypothetical protein